MPQPLSRKILFFLIYLASLLYSFHYAIPLYIESSFISQVIPTAQFVGLVFSFASIFTVTGTFLLPRFLKRFGNYRTTLTVMGLEIFALIILALVSNPIAIVVFFVMQRILGDIIFLNLDYFVEAFTDNEKTGGMRAIFMTVLNVAYAVAPFLAGLMLTDHEYWKIWLGAALFMALGFLVIARYFKNYEDPDYIIPNFKTTFYLVRGSHDLHSIIFMHFALSFFYVWMVIYMPIYLNKFIGIPMHDILGVIIPIALLPFVLFEVGLGKLADKKLGEKEILTVGFLIMGLSTMSVAWVTTASLTFWAILLFITRTGASAVEAMTESYFYKQVGPGDAHLITFMRTLRATSYIIAPVIGSVLLYFISFNYLWLILGIFMLSAIWFSLTIKDTK